MINLTSSGGTITFAFDNNSGYLQNGTIEVPVNSLSLVIDESDMVTFKKANSNDVFVSALASDFGMSKAQLISFYKNNMVDSFINADEAQSMIDESISGKADVSAATIVNQTSGTVTSAKTTTHGGESITLNFAYNDGVTSFSGGCIGMVAFDNPRTPFVKYTTIDGVVKNAERGSDTDEYNYQNVSRKVVITMKGDNRLTYIEMGYEDPVTINYTYDYVTNQSVAVSTFIEDEINPKIETIESSLSGKADTSAVTAVNNVVTAHTANTSIHVTSADKTAWNAKSDFSGSYNDLTDKPTIPTVPTSNTAFTNDAGYITEDALSGYAESSAVTEEITATISGKADTSAVTAVQDSLSGYVTTDTLQDITAQKTFVGDPNNSRKSIKFKQYDNTSKVGFVVVNSASTNNELAAFELRPDTYTDSSSVQHPLLYLGHYRNNSLANAGVPQTMIGFRQYDQSGAAAYHYLLPLPAEAKTPFSLTTSFKNYFAPLGFKNGDTMITTDNTGVADLSSELGGLKLKKLTQAEYDALATKDSNTLYVVTDS